MYAHVLVAVGNHVPGKANSLPHYNRFTAQKDFGKIESGDRMRFWIVVQLGLKSDEGDTDRVLSLLNHLFYGTPRNSP